jgi:hypothetical protein
VLRVHSLGTTGTRDGTFFLALDALDAASTRIIGRAIGHGHGVGNDQAVVRGDHRCRFGSNCTGHKACEDEGENGCVNEEFHNLVTSGSP